MRAFVERRLTGRVKSKDALLLDAMKRCQVGPAATVLEIGCNDGRYLSTFTALHGCGGVGIDLSEHAVRQALDAGPVGSRNDFHVSDAFRSRAAQAGLEVSLVPLFLAAVTLDRWVDPRAVLRVQNALRGRPCCGCTLISVERDTPQKIDSEVDFPASLDSLRYGSAP